MIKTILKLLANFTHLNDMSVVLDKNFKELRGTVKRIIINARLAPKSSFKHVFICQYVSIVFVGILEFQYAYIQSIAIHSNYAHTALFI